MPGASQGRCFEAAGIPEPPHSAAPELPQLPQQPKPSQQRAERRRRRLPEQRCDGPQSRARQLRPLQRLPEFRGTPGSKAAEATKAGVLHEATQPRWGLGGVFGYIPAATRWLFFGKGTGKDGADSRRCMMLYVLRVCHSVMSHDPFGKEQGASLGGRQSVKH